MKAKKGISPILATVILIAVTLVIAVGVIGWVMGIWGSMGKTETLKIISGNITVYTTGTQKAELYLDVINQGTVDATIHKVVVGSKEFSPQDPITIKANGTIHTIKVDLDQSSNYSPGVSYSVTVVTTAGNQYPFVVQAVQGP
uniref:Type IV pilin n=1 Tax=Fervidicoccus fontis TaxID=683846 RepID=A0A7C1I812_9CREN